jgi:hypothetical protein
MSEPLPAASPPQTVTRFDVTALLAQEQRRKSRDLQTRGALRIAVGTLACGGAVFLLLRDGVNGVWIAALLGGFGVFTICFTIYFWRRSQRPASGYVDVTGSYVEFEVPTILAGYRMRWDDPSFALTIVDDHTIGATSTNPRLPRGIYVGPDGSSGVPVPLEAYRVILELAELHGLVTSHKRIRNPKFFGGGETDWVSIHQP